MKVWYFLALLCLVSCVAAGCGTEQPTQSSGFRLVLQRIIIPGNDSTLQNNMNAIRSDGLEAILSTPDVVQALYAKTLSLPYINPTRICAAVLTTSYTLTFIRDNKTVLYGIADGGGCGTFIIAKNNERQPDPSFWALLHQDLED